MTFSALTECPNTSKRMAYTQALRKRRIVSVSSSCRRSDAEKLKAFQDGRTRLQGKARYEMDRVRQAVRQVERQIDEQPDPLRLAERIMHGSSVFLYEECCFCIAKCIC